MAKVIKKRSAKEALTVGRLTKELRLVSKWQTRLAEALEEAGQPIEDPEGRHSPQWIADFPGFPGGVGPGPGTSKCATYAFRDAQEVFRSDLAVVSKTLSIWTTSVSRDLAKFQSDTRVPQAQARVKKPRAQARTRAKKPRAPKPRRT